MKSNTPRPLLEGDALLKWQRATIRAMYRTSTSGLEVWFRNVRAWRPSAPRTRQEKELLLDMIPKELERRRQEGA